MLARAARAAAAEWLRIWVDNLAADQRPGFCGAFVIGSLAELDDAAEFNHEASDIDIVVVVDPEHLPSDQEQYPDGKFSIYGKFMVQESFLPISILREPEKLFSMLGLGCNLRAGRVLSDPGGAIGEARDLIAASWGDSEWATRRLDRAIDFSASAISDMKTATGPAQKLRAACDTIMQIAGLVAIASLRTPTHRRALVKARDIMADRDAGLYERLIASVASPRLSAADVDDVIDDARLALAIEQKGVTDLGLSPEIVETLPAFIVAGVHDIIRAGYLRESLLPAFNAVAESCIGAQSAVGDDEKTVVELASRNLERLTRGQSWPDYSAMLDEIGKDVGQFARTLLPQDLDLN